MLHLWPHLCVPPPSSLPCPLSTRSWLSCHMTLSGSCKGKTKHEGGEDAWKRLCPILSINHPSAVREHSFHKIQLFKTAVRRECSVSPSHHSVSASTELIQSSCIIHSSGSGAAIRSTYSISTTSSWNTDTLQRYGAIWWKSLISKTSTFQKLSKTACSSGL